MRGWRSCERTPRRRRVPLRTAPAGRRRLRRDPAGGARCRPAAGRRLAAPGAPARATGADAAGRADPRGGDARGLLDAVARAQRGARGHAGDRPAPRRGRAREPRPRRRRRRGRDRGRPGARDTAGRRGPVRPRLHRRRQAEQRGLPRAGAGKGAAGRADRGRQHRARRRAAPTSPTTSRAWSARAGWSRRSRPSRGCSPPASRPSASRAGTECCSHLSAAADDQQRDRCVGDAEEAG